MGGWKVTPPCVYLVHWPSAGVTKAGYSYRQRWRRFALREAEVLAVVEFTNSSDAFAFETQMHDGMDKLGPLAFTVAHQAIPYLGDSGGYKECYLISKTDALALLAALLPDAPRHSLR